MRLGRMCRLYYRKQKILNAIPSLRGDARRFVGSFGSAASAAASCYLLCVQRTRKCGPSSVEVTAGISARYSGQTKSGDKSVYSARSGRIWKFNYGLPEQMLFKSSFRSCFARRCSKYFVQHDIFFCDNVLKLYDDACGMNGAKITSSTLL